MAIPNIDAVLILLKERARPEHYTTSIDLLLGSESIVGAATSASPDADYQFVSDLGDDNVVKKGDIVTLAYDDSECTLKISLLLEVKM